MAVRIWSGYRRLGRPALRELCPDLMTFDTWLDRIGRAALING